MKNLKSILKKVTVVSMACVLAFGMVSCGSSEDNKSGEAKTYKAALEATFPPFDTTDEEGNLTGFDVDLLNAIAKDQGFEVEWVSMGFDGLIPALQSGNVDIVASGMWASDERKKEVDFSDTYYDSGLVVAVTEENNTIKGADDITSDMVVAAQIGTSSADLIQKWQEEGKIKEAKIYDKVSDAIMDLQNGTVAALINDKPVTQEYISKQPGEIKIVGETLNKESYGIAVKKDNKEMLDMINAGLKNLKENGTYDELLKKWNLA